MKRTLTRHIVTFGFALLAGFAGATLPALTAMASPASEVTDGVQAAGGGGADQASLSSFIVTIINVLLFIIGAVAVIMIILGGLKYVLSNGDSNSVTSAKNTILYAVIGLVVALLAYAIVNFVLKQFGK